MNNFPLKTLLISFLLCVGIVLRADCSPKMQSQVLICGICKDIAQAIPNTITNIEKLGNRFTDYKVVIYENNSSDKTADLIKKWALKNKKVIFISENVPNSKLSSISRTEKIARARNKILEEVRKLNYKKYSVLIMADLDFMTQWPIDEIVHSTKLLENCDCITANGIRGEYYWDRYAFRSEEHPFGPEMIGDIWWDKLVNSWFVLEKDELYPVYSAFGGLALYRTKSILSASYSGKVTKDLEAFYKMLFPLIDQNNFYKKEYLKNLNLPANLNDLNKIAFQLNTLSQSPENYPFVTCCEHVTLHASMALNGYNRIFINPKLIMKY